MVAARGGRSETAERFTKRVVTSADKIAESGKPGFAQRRCHLRRPSQSGFLRGPGPHSVGAQSQRGANKFQFRGEEGFEVIPEVLLAACELRE